MVAITGGIGSGKSEVAAILARWGATVIDTDDLAHQVTDPPGPVFDQLVARFGPSVVGAGGELDRRALAGIAFADPDAWADLNAIVHPAVARALDERLGALDPWPPVVAVVVPLLVEAAWVDRFEVVVVVDCPEALAADRLVHGRGMSPDEVASRMRTQASRQERLAVADHVVVNDGSTEQLETRVRALWEALGQGPGPGSGGSRH